MKQYQTFAAIVCTFFFTALAFNQAHRLDMKNIKAKHKHETDSLKREIIELEECLFVKKIAD